MSYSPRSMFNIPHLEGTYAQHIFTSLTFESRLTRIPLTLLPSTYVLRISVLF